MDNQQLFNIFLSLSGALGGWILKILWDAISDLKTDMKDLTQEIHIDFLRKEDYKDDIYDIKDMLTRIFDKLDLKADK